jgi:hypothetical protein
MNQSLLDLVVEKVLRDSLRLRKGENVTIETWNSGLPFAERVGVLARKAGALPLLFFEDEDSFIEGFRGGVKEMGIQMGGARTRPPIEDRRLRIHSGSRARRLFQVDSR